MNFSSKDQPIAVLIRILFNLVKYNNYLSFLFVGGLNALIYAFFLLSFMYLTENYYLSVGLSQVFIAIIAYMNFSFMSFRQKTSYFRFFKFCISNILLFLLSTLLVLILKQIDISVIQFTVINVLVIAPTSYVFNSYFVFKD